MIISHCVFSFSKRLFLTLCCFASFRLRPPPPATKPTAVNADICVPASLEIICCASPLGSAHTFSSGPPRPRCDPSRVRHIGFCSTAPSGANHGSFRGGRRRQWMQGRQLQRRTRLPRESLRPPLQGARTPVWIH